MYSADDSATGIIYCEDNLELLRDMDRDSVDLIYLDPPFFSNRNYEVIWGDEAEMRSFEDRWEGSINYYIDWMKKRVVLMHRVLKPTGSLYLHCDWHAGHYLKRMLDGVFGSNRFQNEIVWYYRGGGVSPKRWGRRHDTIFFYTKGDRWTFNVDPVRTPYSQESLERLRYKARAFRGENVYDNYEANPKGKHPDDVWPMQPIMPSDKERLGYPTQKPERLLERIISASSNPEDLVLDPFCGCGTTIAVAQQLERRWVGVDISLTAAQIMKARVEKVGAEGVKLINEPKTEEELRKLKPFEFQNWVIRRVDGDHSPRKSGDMGIDGFSFLDQSPIQIKRSYGVGRPVVDEFETAVRRYGASKGYIVAFSFTGGAKEETARLNDDNDLEIELVEVDKLLKGTSELVAPVLNRRVLEMPLPKSPPKAARPSPDELVESEKNNKEVSLTA